MLNKKSTQTISTVLLEEDLKRMDKVIEKYNMKFKTRSDFIRAAIERMLEILER